ncbi:MAG: hypothetical protein KDC62_09690 [Aequorivita sp.]|nr:hypothetical protein [Aequorivita sp.]
MSFQLAQIASSFLPLMPVLCNPRDGIKHIINLSIIDKTYKSNFTFNGTEEIQNANESFL